MKTKILFLSVPRVDPRKPLPGPALLKAYLEEFNIGSKYADWNRDLYNHCLFDREFWNDNSITSKKDADFHEIWDNTKDWTLNYLQQYITEEIQYIGLSILSFQSDVASIYLMNMIREYFPHLKIIIGGTRAEAVGEQYLKDGLIDYYIGGDGEEALLALLNNDFMHPGINNTHISMTSMDEFPPANYNDLDLSIYDSIYLVASKGCVRNCTFCDINNIWPKYQYKSPWKIVSELKYYRKHYPSVHLIRFSDSLINGSPPKFKEMLLELAQADLNFKFAGQLIVRTPNQMPEEIYALMRQVGFHTVIPGIESGSEEVRKHMKKPFKDEDLRFYLNMAKKYKLKSSFLFIIGYVTETEEDFQKTLDLVKLLAMEYKDIVSEICSGEQLFLLENTPLHKQPELFKTMDFSEWESIDGLTKEKRLDRLARFNKHIELLGLPGKIRKPKEPKK